MLGRLGSQVPALSLSLRCVPPGRPVPPESPLAEKDGQLYWQWAFESPHNVKVVVRKELGEENTPQVRFELLSCQ